MNIRQVCGSAVVTGLVGAAVGLGVAKIATPEFVSKQYQELPARYPVYGAIAGAIVGGCQCAILQIKKQRDQEDPEGR